MRGFAARRRNRSELQLHTQAHLFEELARQYEAFAPLRVSPIRFESDEFDYSDLDNGACAIYAGVPRDIYAAPRDCDAGGGRIVDRISLRMFGPRILRGPGVPVFDVIIDAARKTIEACRSNLVSGADDDASNVTRAVFAPFAERDRESQKALVPMRNFVRRPLVVRSGRHCRTSRDSNRV